MALLARCIGEGPHVFRIFISPTIERTARMRLIRQAFEGRIHVITMNFLQVLVLRRRQSLLKELPPAFQTIIDRNTQCLRGRVASARPLTEEEQQELIQRIRVRTGRPCECDFSVDTALRSGFRVMIGDKLIDCSSMGALARLRRLLTAGWQE
jgi:F-type H+-transporting ATPase subunit delta